MNDEKPTRIVFDSPSNEDWLRSMSWDLPDYKTAEELANGIAPMSLEDFMTLPAAKPMPLALRTSVMSFLEARAVMPIQLTLGNDTSS